MIDFFPSQTPAVLAAREFTQKILLPNILEDDKLCRFQRSHFNALAQQGLHSLTHPIKYGARGESHKTYYHVLLELARGSLAFSVATSVTNLVQGALLAFGNEEQKNTYYKDLLSGKLLGAFSLSEPQSGSDASALILSAKPVDGGYRLTGTKCWCSNAGMADIYLVMCRTDKHKTRGITALLVPANTPGFRIGKYESKMGLHASTLAELIFEDCFVPAANRLGKEGQGFTVALSQLDGGRISIGTASIGLTLACIDTVLQWGKTNPEKLTEYARQCLGIFWAEATAIWTLIQRTALLKDQGKNITSPASQIKLLASELAMRASSECVHLMQEDGLKPEFHVERYFRDAKALQIVEGTTQVQKLVLARALDKLAS